MSVIGELVKQKKIFLTHSLEYVNFIPEFHTYEILLNYSRGKIKICVIKIQKCKLFTF